MRLDPDTLEFACRDLAVRDDALGALFARNGVPPLWRRDSGFTTLVKLILEQQVSLASGAAAYRRLAERLGCVEAEAFLTLDDDELRAVGFSRQKTRYARMLAEALIDGSLDLDAVASMGDDEAMATLTSFTGIGPWTAANYLLFGLGRPDLWPNGDRALVVSMQRVLSLDEVPSYEEAGAMAESWRPWRSVAARLLWHDYLGGPDYDDSGFA